MDQRRHRIKIIDRTAINYSRAVISGGAVHFPRDNELLVKAIFSVLRVRFHRASNCD